MERAELHNLNVDRSLVKEVQDALQTATARAKMRRYEEFDSYSTECELARSQKFYFNEMLKATEKISITGLLPEWEANIRELTNRSQLRHKYVHIFEERMQETKERYYQTMRSTAICHIIAVECEDKYHDDDSFVVSSYKYSGHGQFSAKFLKSCHAFAKQYYLSHRLIRGIVAKAHHLLPKIFCDFGSYRNLDYLPIDKLFNSLETDMKRSTHIITASYYSDIVRLVSQRRYTQDVSTSILPRFLKCATNLLGLQIITRAIDTIEHLLNVLADRTTIPLLKLELKCDNHDLYISPRLEELYNAFHSLVDEIANIACHLSPLESWLLIKRGQRQKGEGKGRNAINIANNDIPFASPPNWYLHEAHERLSVILRESFKPLSDYLEGLWLQFGCIIYKPDKALHNAAAAAAMHVETKHFLQDYFAKVEEFNRLIRVIYGMPDNEYLETIQLHQTVAKHGLVTHATELRKLVIDELVKHHWNYNIEICDTFETLKERALNVPLVTRELLDLGQYMLTATSTMMVELQNKIKFSLRMMSSLIEMTTLSRHHIELNNTTVQWLKRIRSVFERSSVMYEQNKFELQEKLQEEVVNLNERVESMFPRLVIMNNMDDAERIRDYIEDMRKMVCQLKRMEEKAEWINAEEALFKFPLTLYPRIKEVKENIFPFYSLIYRGHQWQRDRKVWLDGAFESLDVEHIDNKLDRYLTDFIKTSKQYRTKLQLQQAINYPYSFSGMLDDPDPFQQPAPLKLCHQLIEDVKWLKEYVPLLKILRDPEISQLHWDDDTLGMVEFDFIIDAGTTLRKIISVIFTSDNSEEH